MALLCAPHTTLLLPLCSYSSSSKAAATTMKRNRVVVRMADVSTGERGNASVSAFEFEEGHLERPSWVGETPASRLVGALLSFKPLFSLLKLGARRVLISTAERTKIPWREMATEILESEVYKEMESIENPSLKYPDYYLNPFHAYDEGNLSWLGLDLSPYFLAVAQYKEKRKAPRNNPIRWIHANGEDTGLTSNSFDLVSLAYTIHECPARAIVGLVKEAFRLLRPGGTIALTDNSVQYCLHHLFY
eukprot:TRINITY_DN955_c0_g1_i1.p1 TRINITY_DN955_c0_g1~~TRINITY_DN955_c0_g1_i1.p1  ORF type:complete len:247 (-),score=44.60 TRINITY_DN955_c0_g1_i1:83-823(-)